MRANALLAIAVLALAAGCASLPPLDGRVETRALTADSTRDTRLGAPVAALASAHPGLTGVHPMNEGTDAFAARVLLAAAADRAIDAQYYIWHADQTGLLLLQALRDAARRGVRVRLLLDDQNTRDIEKFLPAFAAEPNVELRLYNPFASRSGRALGYVGDFERLNRRMHNKAFVADGQVAVVGGRNIGNEYFGAGTEVPFKDLDVVAIGAAVPAIESEFDLYWNSASAYPAPLLLGAPSSGAAAELDARFAANHDDPESRKYIDAVRGAPLVESLLQHRLALEWAQARLVHDDPAKTLGASQRTDVLLLAQVFAVGERPRATFDIISPYFVPGEKGTAFLADLARSGVTIRVLTNSYQATDVSVVHSGYAKRRCELARAGVRLFELKPSIDGDGKAAKSATGSSGARLHAKTYAADRERIFVGSFNFDPRSALLNTEMGLIIASPPLASRLATFFDERAPEVAYEVRPRDGGDCIEWIERTAGGDVRYESEPRVGWLRRGWLAFLASLPLDWML